MLNSNCKKVLTWNVISSELNVYPSSAGITVTVVSIPSTAKEILINHNTLGDVIINRKDGGIVYRSYYIDEYYRIKAYFEWKNNNLYYAIDNLGTAENIASHFVHQVKYR